MCARSRTAGALIVALSVFGCASKQGANTFTKSGVFSGSQMTEEHCQAAVASGTAVWVVVEGQGECIRYFPVGLERGENANVVVFFHGDRMQCGNAKRFCKEVSWYKNTDADAIADRAKRIHKLAGVASIRFSRPGVYGSSGDHGDRRLRREVSIVDAALSAIRQRHNIARFTLVGQSGGGHIVASMLSHRTDIGCAVIASGVSAVKARVKSRGWPADATGYSTFFDPVDEVDNISEDTNRRIFVVGDRLDNTVPFETQELYYKRLAAAGHQAALLSMQAKGKNHHSLSRQGIVIAGWCARGISTPEILDRTRDGLLPPEKT